MSDKEIRIWVGCLAAYNAGHLHGAWIDVVGKDAEEILGEVDAMLRRSPVEGAEEWAIFDHDGFGGIPISENQSLESVVAIAGVVAEHGLLGAKYLVCANLVDNPELGAGRLRDRYRGAYDSLADWAEEFLVETQKFDGVHEDFRTYFDFERWARDLELNREVFTICLHGKLHVFWSS